MGRALWLADVLSDAGLRLKVWPGWASRGRNDFDPQGVIIHHTATRPTASDQTIDRLLAERGSSSVSPPLCQYSTNRDGTVSLIASGTANHGGVGRWNGVAGNKFWFGDEMKNLGSKLEPWPAIQLESAYRAAAAILDHLGKDASWVCGHKEYATPPGRKIDPHTLSMTTARSVIAELQEDDVPLTDEDIEKVAAATQKKIMSTVLRDGVEPDLYVRSFQQGVQRTEIATQEISVQLGVEAAAITGDLDNLEAIIRQLPKETVDLLAVRLANGPV